MSPRSSFESVSPVVLSSSCDVARNSTGVPDYGQLSYPFRKAIVIEEIRWTLRMTGTNLVNLGALVATTMQMGRHYIAKNPVPIWLFGTVMDRTQEQIRDFTVIPIVDTKTIVSMFRWRLPEPLTLEPGQILTPVFSRGLAAGIADDALAANINVQVTYAGRTVAPGRQTPRLLPVPYVGRFVTNSGVSYQQSNENHLFNVFDKPLRVQRLTGRVLYSDGAGSFIEVQRLTPRPAGSNMTLLMSDSWGGKMVNNQTGPSDVFDVIRGAWTCDTMMPAKGQYNIQVSNIATNPQEFLHVGMVGVREENS